MLSFQLEYKKALTLPPKELIENGYNYSYNVFLKVAHSLNLVLRKPGGFWWSSKT